MAQVGISQAWLDNLSRYLDRLRSQSVEQADDTVRFLHEQVVEKARNTPGWEALADEIEVWSEDGKLWIGVRNTQFVSEAWITEYGNELQTPNPLLRTLTDQVSLTNAYATTAAIARYGTSSLR